MTEFLDSLGRRNTKKYPNRKWTQYWGQKKNHAEDRGISWELTIQDKLQLIEEFPAEGDMPNRTGGYQLGRLDHDRGYSMDNVEWQLQADNVRESNSRVGPARPKREDLPRYPNGLINYWEARKDPDFTVGKYEKNK